MRIPGTVRKVLYHLKHRCNVSAVLTTITFGAINPDTGAKTLTSVNYSINRIVVLPETIQNKYLTRVPYEVGDKIIVIDNRDLPSTFVWGQENKVTIDGDVFIVNSHDLTDYNSSYFCSIRRTQR